MCVFFGVENCDGFYCVMYWWFEVFFVIDGMFVVFLRERRVGYSRVGARYVRDVVL